MGASAWNYYVAWQPDAGRALRELREEVFRGGQYYNPHDPWRPATIEHLLEMNAEAGTHSILDIFAVGERPDYGVAAPLTRDELVRRFGTERPTRATLDAAAPALEEVRESRGRWGGTYIVVYDGDEPSEILFLGQSGD